MTRAKHPFIAHAASERSRRYRAQRGLALLLLIVGALCAAWLTASILAPPF
jgi:hypothetical protein